MPLIRSHFSDAEWTDYVRGTLPAALCAGLQKHLDTACASCTKLHGTWRAIHEAAQAATLHEPSEGTLRIAKALFGLREPEGRGAHASSMAQLLFDSRMAMASGFRSASTVSRKYVFATGKYLVDVQLQDDEKGRPTQLVGQVTAQDGVDASFEGSPVLLLRDMQVIARASLNRIGEFHLDFDGHATGMSLALGLKYGGTVIKLDMTRTES
jgi:hypothetical protein